MAGQFSINRSFDSSGGLIVAFGTFGGTEVPIPAAAPLFASGLGVIGFAAWRRKRKPAV